MKVIIAEKPSVAKSIAAIVGAKSRKNGYLEGNGYAVTWAFGHLVAPALPEEYGFKGFKRENLPILPKPFIIKPRQVRVGKSWKDEPGAAKQLNIIKSLFDTADRIIVATDAGREGELIFRFIYSYLNCQKPFDRLWISSLTDRAIREGLQNLRPGMEYNNLYLSAKARSEADWLVGINASQALSIAAGRGVWSLGRVQTPTLAIICSRYLENTAFTPQTYYQLKLHTAKDVTLFSALSTDRYEDKGAAVTASAAVTSAGRVQVVKVERKEVDLPPPLLYDLTALQKEANSKHGFSADQTLSIAQTLYEAKLITYPRTGSRYISADVFEEIPHLIAMLRVHPLFGKYIDNRFDTTLNTRSVNDAKVTDHHALLPTENLPSKLSDDERTIYEMVAGRMLEAFSPACRKENTSVFLRCAEMDFTARGSIFLSVGWRGVFGTQNEEKEEDATVLPNIVEGDNLPVTACYVLEKQTKPRPIHTESSLLAAMESCGRDLVNDEEREVIKESGIGTPATRAAIIETLFTREYVHRERKNLIPTEKGLAVYEVVKDKKIADVAMTGGWELALSKIASGEMEASTFIKGIEIYTYQITSELLDAKLNLSDDRTTYPCPKCIQGTVVFYPNAVRCTNPDCKLAVYRTKAKRELSDKQIIDLLKNGKTGVIEGFQNKTTGKIFSAIVAFDENFNTQFVFLDNKRGTKRKK